MTTKTIYRYLKDNSVIYSPNKPDSEYTEYYRLIADEGMVLTKDEENFYSVIDVDKTEASLWKEVTKPEPVEEIPET